MSKVRYRYVGPDRFANVPTEDLTDEMFDRLPLEARLDVEANASYQLVEDVDLESFKLDELRERAKALAVEKAGSLAKVDLVKAIEKAEQDAAKDGDA